MKRIICAVLCALLALSVTACGANHSDDLMKNITPQLIRQANLTDVSDAAVTDFALRLFKASIEDDQNTLISPLSVLVALSMTANGADNETLSQMEAVLGMPINELNGWVHAYINKLPENENYKLSMANSIWLKDNLLFEVSKDFLQTNADYYNADIYKAPFDTSTVKEINNWVEKHTDGMIKNILDQIPEEAIMYLINALAFDAQWEDIYTESRISEGIFTTEDGTAQRVEMMYSEEGRYLEDDNAVGFIKYYKDRRYALAALLPNEGMSVADYILTLDENSLNELLANAEVTAVNAAMPKFETEYKVEMSEILTQMGMPDAFDPNKADFTRIGNPTEGNILISRVIHQTYINVDGKGTKAGAATVIEMVTESAMEPAREPKTVHLDRPFVYMLIDCETNLPFFIGTLMDAGIQ